ncbi:hypothetical protein HMPREF9567_00747 [Cutibacterium acnes HL013PA1]|nr:hypothetical protein HMPREF9567_00747 [Cutibacterium acnes HL013PA1]
MPRRDLLQCNTGRFTCDGFDIWSGQDNGNPRRIHGCLCEHAHEIFAQVLADV